MLVFLKNKYISSCLKEGVTPTNTSWVDEFDGKPVKKINNNNYEEIGGHRYMANPEWVAEVDDKYFGG